MIEPRSLFIADVESHSLSNYLLNAALVFGIITEITLAVLSTKLSYHHLLQFPNILIIYYWFLIAPTVTTLIASFIYYTKHADLRKTIIREIKNYF
jgi:hypothetical protein